MRKMDFPKKLFSVKMSIRSRRKKFRQPNKKQNDKDLLLFAQWPETFEKQIYFFEKSFLKDFHWTPFLQIWHSGRSFSSRSWESFGSESEKNRKKNVFFQTQFFFLKLFPWPRRSLAGRRCEKTFDKSRKYFAQSPGLSNGHTSFLKNRKFSSNFYFGHVKCCFDIPTANKRHRADPSLLYRRKSQ